MAFEQGECTLVRIANPPSDYHDVLKCVERALVSNDESLIAATVWLDPFLEAADRLSPLWRDVCAVDLTCLTAPWVEKASEAADPEGRIITRLEAMIGLLGSSAAELWSAMVEMLVERDADDASISRQQILDLWGIRDDSSIALRVYAAIALAAEHKETSDGMALMTAGITYTQERLQSKAARAREASPDMYAWARTLWMVHENLSDSLDRVIRIPYPNCEGMTLDVARALLEPLGIELDLVDTAGVSVDPWIESRWTVVDASPPERIPAGRPLKLVVRK